MEQIAGDNGLPQSNQASEAAAVGVRKRQRIQKPRGIQECLIPQCFLFMDHQLTWTKPLALQQARPLRRNFLGQARKPVKEFRELNGTHNKNCLSRVSSSQMCQHCWSPLGPVKEIILPNSWSLLGTLACRYVIPPAIRLSVVCFLYKHVS